MCCIDVRTVVADDIGDAILAISRSSALNGTGIANADMAHPSWSKDSIMAITFGIVGTGLGVAAVWLVVRRCANMAAGCGRGAGEVQEEMC